MEQSYEIESLKVIVRQYRTKMKKIRTPAMAGIGKDEILMERVNNHIESGSIFLGRLKIDPEDDDDTKKVEYWYIDNELFTNEY